MKIRKNIFIQKYNQDNRLEYIKVINKIPDEFRILQVQRFDLRKNIFILQKKGLFGKVKLISYAIICDNCNMLDKEKAMLAKVYSINEKNF